MTATASHLAGPRPGLGIAMLALRPRYPTSLWTSLASPPVAVNSPPAPDAGVADVPATGGTTVTGSAMTSAMAGLIASAQEREDIQ